MTVVDASVAVLGLLHDGEARAALENSTITCPHLVDAEVAQALRGLVRRGSITAAAGRRALGVWSPLGLQRVGTLGLLPRMWALRENLSAYDAAYVALAETLDQPLLTADARLAGAPGPRCVITVVRR